MRPAELERVLVRLIGRSLRIIDVRRARVFDVGAEHVRHHFAARELHQPMDARDVGRAVSDVQPPRVQRVARQEHARLSIVDRD